ncbi:methyltransferase [Streptomonospora sediminis]
MPTEPASGESGTTSADESYDSMFSMITAYWRTQVVAAMARFSIAEHLDRGVRTAEEIADLESTDPDATRRLLRAGAAIGLATSQDGVHYAPTPLLEPLRADSPRSLRSVALALTAPGHWLPWGRFPDAVQAGTTQAVAAYGTDIFDYYARTPDEAALFTQAMGNLTAPMTDQAAEYIDTSSTSLAVDVGGADGSLVQELMVHNPRLHGAVVDLPHVVPDSAESARKKGLEDRFSAVPGDFFESVPAADLYLLKFVLHDWDDEACVRILGNCRAALRENGRVVIVEMHMAPGDTGVAPLMDLNMLSVSPSGSEREIGEYDALLSAAGLRRTATHRPPRSQYCYLEAVPVQQG